VSFHFLFDCMRHFAFSDGVAEAEIVLGDQAPGLIAEMPISMPNCKLQYCNWHVSQNIKKRLAEKKYLAEERNTIMNHVWWYIQSASEADLVENRKRLLEMVLAFSSSISRDASLVPVRSRKPGYEHVPFVPSPLSVQPTITAQTPHLYSTPDRPGLLSTIFVVVKFEMSAIALLAPRAVSSASSRIETTSKSLHSRPDGCPSG
jgi:hypothetical protein